LFRQLIDVIENVLATPDIENPMKPIYQIVWMMVIVGFVRIIASFYPSFRAFMNQKFEYILRHRYFTKILEKDYKFFLKFRTGDLVTRLTSDIQDFPKIGWFMCSGIFRAFDAAVRIIFCIVVMFFLCWDLTLLTLIPIPVMVAIFYLVSNKLHKRFQKNQEAISEINNQLEMTFSGIRIIKSFVCEEKYKRFFRNALDNRFKTELKLVRTNTVLHLIYEYIDYAMIIAVILIGGYKVVTGAISIGTFYAFYTYLSMLIWPILDLPQLFVSGKQAFVCIDRLEEIKDFPVTSYNSCLCEERSNPVSNIESIRFENVSFSHEDRKAKILDNISFEVKKGEKMLILGRSGAGKTTILGLLSGLLIPQEGEIFVNDIPLKNLNQVHLRELMGYVPQEPSLFSGTIRDNVYFGTNVVAISDCQPSNVGAMSSSPVADNETYYNTIISAIQMKDEIDQFTQGDLTVIGQKGLTLSGGQKQRLAIARALFKQPELLILDDITASLDAKKEELLWNQIHSMFNNLTAFIVSHRLSSLRYADSVLFLDSGKIIANGKHEELLNTNKIYKEFIQHHHS